MVLCMSYFHLDGTSRSFLDCFSILFHWHQSFTVTCMFQGLLVMYDGWLPCQYLAAPSGQVSYFCCMMLKGRHLVIIMNRFISTMLKAACYSGCWHLSLIFWVISASTRFPRRCVWIQCLYLWGCIVWLRLIGPCRQTWEFFGVRHCYVYFVRLPIREINAGEASEDWCWSRRVPVPLFVDVNWLSGVVAETVSDAHGRFPAILWPDWWWWGPTSKCPAWCCSQSWRYISGEALWEADSGFPLQLVIVWLSPRF